MKKISTEVSKVREENKNFFILENYNTDIKESIITTLALLEAEAKKVNMPLNDYITVLSKISK